MRKVLRTPDDCFENLPGYAYEPHYLTIDDMRMHYVDEGSGEPVLLLHGEPSWSYLYRHMIGPIVDAGFRAIVPDLFGFGRSDKPADRDDYTYAGHVAWVRAFVEALDLEGITLVCQDWGSLIGLRLAAEHEHRFARVVLANGGLPDGNQEMPKAFHVWRTYSQTSPDFPIGDIIQRSTVTDLPPDVVGAYDAPFPSDDFKAGARQFPALVPIRPDDPASAANQAAWQVLTRWDKPFLTAFSDSDPITQGADRVFQKHVPGARDQAHTIIEGGGHFLQEDRGPELAGVVIDFMRENPRGE